jgi:hypothetical protein
MRSIRLSFQDALQDSYNESLSKREKNVEIMIEVTKKRSHVLALTEFENGYLIHKVLRENPDSLKNVTPSKDWKNFDM